jgi:hypothetical protein
MSLPQILTLISLLALLVACSEQVPSSSANALQNSSLQQQATSSGMPPNGMQPPFGAPPGSGGGPMGLPPHIEGIRAQYPELATALEAIQDLGPEERRTRMEALFTEHPEWREVLMPPGGGSGGMPPPQPSASPAA